ncbi:glutathione S-transferase family protein [Aestuariivirga sp.]|uniref:glutathione S-transferase family protein n=1 Tax=Aestuariivirga sp. TaxID=2650926 RepID=UPI003BABD6B0
MSNIHLVIGNKNYSSWSLRPWMALSMAGIPFRETVIPLDTPETAALIAEHSGAGRVPVLHHGRQVVWESLAIMEYLAELFPEKHLWPKTSSARAVARAVSNEMHAGFSALRNACPMNIRRPPRPVPMSEAVNRDVARIEQLWRHCRSKFGKGGKFLFGRFSIADAMYTPVVSRFETFMVPVAEDTRAYMDAVLNTPAFTSWREAALKESWIVPSDEVD